MRLSVGFQGELAEFIWSSCARESLADFFSALAGWQCKGACSQTKLTFLSNMGNLERVIRNSDLSPGRGRCAGKILYSLRKIGLAKYESHKKLFIYLFTCLFIYSFIVKP